MTPSDILYRLDKLSQELDMMVYKLESPPLQQIDSLLRERDVLRIELEQLRDTLNDLADSLL
jgi:regulator of replication initiation timing